MHHDGYAHRRGCDGRWVCRRGRRVRHAAGETLATGCYRAIERDTGVQSRRPGFCRRCFDYTRAGQLVRSDETRVRIAQSGDRENGYEQGESIERLHLVELGEE